ncbi:MAG: hypothetical protein KJO41_01895 [Bacteroidia bacterium]|nr:hypothetical protein [Bacteroidia bacterium]MBT8277725.1 hypothetical protein [Bacteroidia bacterium]NND24832.1 hypothetical protein [Flavobacteriaceae bacterium]NNK59424.1 hypothetical protein [Flavobacteriaceae bacterium]NNL33738.1 hypothetical protein [Flavobacteriaceae bacterium]
MNTDNLNALFEDLKDDFDIETPSKGHQQRFLQKLNEAQKVEQLSQRRLSLWKPFIGIAASLLLIVTLTFGWQSNSEANELASVSPEMETTQDFFMNTISTELAKLSSENDPEFQELVVDAIFQLKILEQDYESLKLNLEESGADKRVIHAMIVNFQNRIEILQNVSEQIEEIKQQKDFTNENSSTL